MKIALAFGLLLSGTLAAAETPFHTSELIFPLEDWHNHGSAIVEAPNGDLIVCWFHGSGERQADDVVIRGARWVKATGRWTEPFLLADTPDFPDTNCCLIIDNEQRLWLLWPTIQANTWESALMKYKISTNYMNDPGPPVWDIEKVMHVKHGEDFEQIVRRKTAAYMSNATISDRSIQWANRNFEQAADKLTRRLGWFTRARPIILDDGRMLVGLYSDGFSFSLTAYTDDGGLTWGFSEPMVGGGNIQPSYAVKRDGTIVAYMRDNGPLPKRIHVAESTDRGETWGQVYDHPILPNPGAGVEIANCGDGEWVCIYNDTVQGRHSLAVSISDDEGQTWKWTRHLELTEPNVGAFHYPSITMGADGMFHASYSYFVNEPFDGQPKGKSIKYARFNKAWVKAGD
jgi:predicted neuraminidase